MRVTDFKKGDKVAYIPRYTEGDTVHKDIQHGVVSSTNERVVFVKYNNLVCEMKTGDEPYIAHATDPEDLIKRK